MSTATSVLVVDDDPMVRSALSMLLRGAHDVELLDAVADGDQVPAAVDSLHPDVVLMDLRMARVDGITATERLQLHPRPPAVLVLTTFDADDDVLGALRAGASGYLLKDTPPDDLVAAVLRVGAGDPVLSPSVMRQLMDRTAAGEDTRARAERTISALSPKERDVVRAVGLGRTNAEIARSLHMSVATVKSHLTHIFTKLDLTNRTQIAVLAHEARLA